jgi:hypothetical protein
MVPHVRVHGWRHNHRPEHYIVSESKVQLEATAFFCNVLTFRQTDLLLPLFVDQDWIWIPLGPPFWLLESQKGGSRKEKKNSRADCSL